MLSSVLLPLSFNEPLEKIKSMIPYYKKLETNRIFLLHIGSNKPKALNRYKKKLFPYNEILEDAGFKTEHILKTGSVPMEIINTARETDAGYISFPFHKKNLMTRAIMGSHIKDVIRLSEIPVLVFKKPKVRTANDNVFKILCPLSLRRGDKMIIPYIKHNDFKAERMILLHVGKRAPDPTAETTKQEKVKNYFQELIKDCGLEGEHVEMITTLGSPRRKIVKEAYKKSADLIIVGKSDAPNSSDSVLGSTSAEVSYNAPCSTMIVPFRDFI